MTKQIQKDLTGESGEKQNHIFAVKLAQKEKNKQAIKKP